MLNKAIVKRVVCLLVMLAAVSSTLSAQRVWKSGEVSISKGEFPAVGDYISSDNANIPPVQVVHLERDGDLFHMVTTLVAGHEWYVNVYTNDEEVVNYLVGLPSNPLSTFGFTEFLPSLLQFTGGYLPFQFHDVLAGTHPALMMDAGIHFADRSPTNGKHALIILYGAGLWMTSISPTIYNPDGKTVFYTPYKGQ